MQPFWVQFMSPNMGMPTANNQMSYQQLRSFSESAIPRRAINYIRDQVSRLDYEFVVKPGKKLTSAQKKQLQAVQSVLSAPNIDENFQSFIGQMIEDMLVIGWGIAEVKAFAGHPEQPYLLYPIDSASIQVYMDWDGNPNTRRYAQFDLHGKKIDFMPSQLLIFKHTPRSNTPFGLSPLEVAVQNIQYLLDAQVYAGRTASNATPKKLLFMGKEVTEEQLRDFRAYFKAEIEGNSHLPIFGGTDGMQSIELGNVGDQALFLEWQKFQIAIIADVFGLDLMKFNVTIGVTRSNGDMLDDVSDESAIRPMAHQIEHIVNQRLLAYFGLSEYVDFRFLFTSSYTDRKSLAVIHQMYGQLDVLTINEMRREQGKPDLPVDEKTGVSKGDYTVSEYRGIYGGQVNLNDAIGIDDDMGTTGQLAIAKENAAAKDPNNNGGNNGVHGAPNPTVKPSNQHHDKGTSIHL
jgi:HK97 family phage portal protein